MRVVEMSGRTIDEAVRDALRQLGARHDDVEVEVVEEGSKGLFGLLGSRRARVRVQLKPGVEPQGAGPEDFSEDEDAEIEPWTDDAVSQESAAGRGPKPPFDLTAEDVRVMEEKLETARQFVAGVLEHLEVEAALELRLDDDGISHIHIVGDELGLIIGRRGQTLDALQFLTNQAVNKDSRVRVRIVLDAGGYRERRAEALEALAGRMADKAVRYGRKVPLEPMNAYERRIVHMSLADDDAVETYSEGEEPHRRIIIAPKRGQGHNW